MGRYYSGDIEGKFWFALQSSDCADRFGKIGEIPCYLEYYFDIHDLPDVEAEIQSIESTLGNVKEKIDKFFEENNGYNEEKLKEHGITIHHLSEYADLLLGYQIQNSINKNGGCHFSAEL